MVEERIQNAFGEYGTFIHHCIEEYFLGNIELWDLPSYYKNNYGNYIKSSWPAFPMGMAENYYNDGLNFFNNFNFDTSKYDALMVEDKIDYNYNGIDLVVKPDIVLSNKDTKENALLDFKTSKLKNNKYDKDKIDEYLNQMYLYVYFIEKAKNINIDYICIWFIRNNVFKVVKIDRNEMQSRIQWFEDTIKNIKNEQDWAANNTKENQYFCNNICGMRNWCKYKDLPLKG
jgi:hypothetical protein